MLGLFLYIGAMLKIELNNKTVKVFKDFHECKVSEFRKILNYCEKQDKELRDAIDKLNFDKIEEKKMITFLVGWVHTITGLELSDIKRVSFDNLFFFWDMTKFILSLPENYQFNPKIKGVAITESLKTFTGTEILGGKANFEQWQILNQLNDMHSETLNAKFLDMLLQMLVIAYPVDDESDADIKKRLKSFESLSVFEAYSGWFFFAELVHGYTRFFQYLKSSPRNYQKAKVITKYQRARLSEHLSALKLGKFSPLKWLKPEFTVIRLNRYINAN